MKILRLGLAALLLLVAAGIAFEVLTTCYVQHSNPAPGRIVDVGTAKIHIDCHGRSGAGPTTVLEAGGGGTSLVWRLVAPRLATAGRVCAYDRAGQGWSEASSAPRDARDIATELLAALRAAGERGPFIIAAHSRGGIYARTFVRLYPADVAGLVLIDGSVDGLAEAPPPLALESGQLAKLAFGCRASPFGLGRLLTGSGPMPASPADLERALQSGHGPLCSNRDELQAIADGESGPIPRTGELGNRPVVVVTSSGPLKGIDALPPDQRRAVDQYRSGFQRAQSAFLRMSTCSEQRFASRSGHDVQLDEPLVVVSAVDAVRSGRVGNCRSPVGR